MRTRTLSNLESDAALHVAAKHLFRHLHDARALRKNPLVRRFFEDPTIAGLGIVREREVLARIHRLVREAAELCRDTDLAEERDEHALRQYSIVTLQCLEKQPMHAVAAQLGVSLGYCYRERAKVCVRIARFLMDYDDEPRIARCPDVDNFQLLVHRVLQYTTLGDLETALRECDKLVADAPSGYRKVEALRIKAFTSMRFGAPGGAESAFAAATSECERDIDAQPLQQQGASEACLALLGAQIGYYRGNASEALTLAESAVRRFGRLETNGSPHLRELYAESRGELGSSLCNAGEWERGHAELTAAEVQLSQERCASVQLRARVSLDVWKLRTYLPLRSQSWYPARKRLEGLLHAFELSYSSGSLFGATAALRILTEYYASIGNDREMMRAARQTMSLAGKQPSERIRVQTALYLASLLLSTHQWKSALAFMPRAEQLVVCDAYHRQLAAYFAAAWALKSRRFAEAWKLATTDVNLAGNPSLAARRRVIAAAAAYEIDKKRDARDFVEMTVPQAERFGLAPLLGEVYSVAAKVTGSRRYERSAHEVAEVLCA